jgi:hypothetical protein
VNPAASTKRTFGKKDKREPSPGDMGEGHGTREALGNAARRNSPVYRDRHAEKVVTETRESLPRTATAVKSEPISPKGEMVSCGEGGGGGCSTYETRTTQPCGGKDPCFVHVLEEVRVSECSKSC